MNEKKTYEAPKVEKLDFDFSNTVVASGTASDNQNHGQGCVSKNKQCTWTYGNTKNKKNGCVS